MKYDPLLYYQTAHSAGILPRDYANKMCIKVTQNPDFRKQDDPSLYSKYYAEAHRKTISGKLTTMYHAHRQLAINKDNLIHTAHNSIEEFKNWCFADSRFSEIWSDWISSDYCRMSAPTIVRLNVNKPYTLQNILLGRLLDNPDTKVSAYRSATKNRSAAKKVKVKVIKPVKANASKKQFRVYLTVLKLDPEDMSILDQYDSYNDAIEELNIEKGTSFTAKQLKHILRNTRRCVLGGYKWSTVKSR